MRGKPKNAKFQSLCDKICKFFKNFSQHLEKIQLEKATIYKPILENLKRINFLKTNFAAFANALCHLNATLLNKAKMGQFGRGTSLSLLALFGTPLG